MLPNFDPKDRRAPHGAPPWGPFPGKKCSRLCREKFFPLHGRVRGPMGPPTFTQPGTQGPLLLPRRGPWGPPRLVFLRKFFFAGTAGEIFFPLHGRVLAICFFTFLKKSVIFNISSSYSSYEDDIKTSRIPIPFSII